MKRLFSNSCVTVLVMVVLGGVTALFTSAVFFQQSQAVAGNATVTLLARTNTPVSSFVARPSNIPILTLPADEVTVQIETEQTPIAATLPSLFTPNGAMIATATPTSTVTPNGATPETPRHAGTSSYPLTVEAEAYLAQTNVARYQAGVAATRTAIAAESLTIFATLTAEALTTPTGVAP